MGQDQVVCMVVLLSVPNGVERRQLLEISGSENQFSARGESFGGQQVPCIKGVWHEYHPESALKWRIQDHFNGERARDDLLMFRLH